MIENILIFLICLLFVVFFLRFMRNRFGNKDAQNIFCRWGFHLYWFQPDERNGYQECPHCHQSSPFDMDIKF